MITNLIDLNVSTEIEYRFEKNNYGTQVGERIVKKGVKQLQKK